MIGKTISHYRIIEKLGAGGMGEVYRATDSKLGRDVAIKVLPDLFANDPERLARFEREAKLLASLNHPNIAAIYEIEESTEGRALVMELVEGTDLSLLITRGPIPLADALPIAKQISDALEAAHDLGIVHRDLKPANIKVRADGAVKVLDFGLAKALGATGATAAGAALSNSPTITNPALTGRGVILGTAAYMSPEQASGRAVDKRSDLWAFGVVLLEMLTGRQAFTGETVSHVLAAVLAKDPDWASLPSSIPPPIRHLLHRCLEKDRKRRLDSAAAARLDIEDAIAGKPFTVEAPPNTSWRLKFALCAVAAVIILTTGIEIGRLWQGAPAPEGRLIKLSISPAEGTTFDTMAISPDGRMLAFTAADASGKISLWVQSLDSLTAHMLPSTEGAAFPFWSPDSRFVGYSAHLQLHKIAVSGGPPQMICAQDGSRGATWSSNGVILLSPNSAKPLFKVSADGGEAVAVTNLDASRGEVSHRWPYFLPDGRHYLFTMRGDQRDVPGIYVGSLDSSVPKRLTGDISNAAYATSPSGAVYLLFARGRSLLARPFDLDRLEFTGEEVAVEDNVWVNNAWSLAAYSVSRSGVLVFDSVSRGRNVELAWFDRTGARQSALGEFYSDKFSLSPDGTRLALDRMNPQTGRMNLWTVDLGRGGISFRFSPEAKGAEYSPVWSRDGTQIAFASDHAILCRSSNGGGDDLVLVQGDGIVVQDWSRDGRFLLYRKVDPLTKGDLWVLPMPVSKDKPAFSVVKSQSDEGNAAFSPDGKWIAYDSIDDTGTSEVYVQAFSMSASSGKWKVSQGGGLYPQWRGDGKELFYFAANLSKLMSVAVKLGGSFEAEAPKLVFASRFNTGINARFNVMPDGQRFLISVPMAADDRSPATVLLNWTAVLHK